jgi:hypothetical protein
MLLRRPDNLSALLELGAAAVGEVNPATLARGVAERAVALPRTDGAAVNGWNDSGPVLEARFLRDGRVSYWNRFAETR